ncbi:hypothetical protein Nepgr_023213 [Nepenthes gracilis]|uniref:USP domain-containing protein n=1 Tax=Nepenthes gracilis TaxID=150966 RepID=A0AAD3T2E7_NEPGR|nr:hypothetical protein Nepgr_023213 [Nepenthes gracilis]
MLEPLAVKGEARNVSSYFPRPKSVNIGTLFTFNSVVGRAAKPAIAATIDDINAKSSILPGTKLHLIFHDTSCSVFFGIMEALQLIEKDVAVAIGPQSFGIARVNSDIAKEFHVPLWSEVIAIYVDDADGRNGDSASGDALTLKRAEFFYKAAFSPSASTNDISNLWGEVILMESRVIVVHALYFCVPSWEKSPDYYETNTTPADAERNFLTCLADLFTQISSRKKKTGVISPKRFVQRVRKENELFRGYMHQDAHEFLNFLLNELVDILEKESSAAKNQPKNSPFEKLANGPLNGQANGGLKEPLATGVQSYSEKKLLHRFWLSSFNLEVVKLSGTQRIRHAKGEAEEELARYHSHLEEEHQKKLSETSRSSGSNVKRLAEETELTI